MDQTVLPCVFMVCFWIGKSNKSQITFHSSCRGTWKPTANFIEPLVLYPFQVPQREGKVSQDSRIWPAYEHGETAEGSSLESPSDVCVCLRRARCSDAGVWEAAWPQGSGCLFQAVGEIMGQILSLFLHLVGKCGRNSPPKSRWVLRSITTLGTVPQVVLEVQSEAEQEFSNAGLWWTLPLLVSLDEILYLRFPICARCLTTLTYLLIWLRMN